MKVQLFHADTFFLQTVPLHLRVAWRPLCTMTSVAMHRRAVWLKLTGYSEERSLLLHVRCKSRRLDVQLLFTARTTSYTHSTQGDSIGKANILGGDSICQCDTKMSYGHVSNYEWLPRQNCVNPERTVPPSVFSYHSQYSDSSISVTTPDQTHANVK